MKEGWMAEWTHDVPTEPGFYWVRERRSIVTVWQRETDGDWLVPGDEMPVRMPEGVAWRQFWPERIEPPKG